VDIVAITDASDEALERRESEIMDLLEGIDYKPERRAALRREQQHVYFELEQRAIDTEFGRRRVLRRDSAAIQG